MSYHWSRLDQLVSNHIDDHLDDPRDLMDTCNHLIGGIDNHGHEIRTFRHALAHMVECGEFLIWDKDIRDYIETLRQDVGDLPYIRTAKPIQQWQPTTVRCYYQRLIVRTGVKYLDKIRKVHDPNYNGMKY